MRWSVNEIELVLNVPFVKYSNNILVILCCLLLGLFLLTGKVLRMGNYTFNINVCVSSVRI